MTELKQIYNRISKQTQNRLQEIFDSIDFTFEDMYQIANPKRKKMIDIYIEELEDKDLLSGYFGTFAKNIKNRTRVKNSEILELLIYGAYIEEQSKLKETELNIFKEDANYYYQQGQKEVNKTLKKKKVVSVIPDAIFLTLITMPNAKGCIWKDYIEAITKYNAEQIYRQVTIDLQQQKKLDITNDIYQNLIKRQQNSRLNTNGDKISGDIDLTLIGINNKAKLEGIYSFDDTAEVEFVSIEDEKRTEMCNSLDGQRFKVHDWNEFERYSETNGRKTKYKCYGLISGLNLPPINDHFHWCRSTLTYIVAKQKYKKLNIKYKDITNQYRRKRKYKVIEQPYYIAPNGEKYNIDGRNVRIKANQKEREVAKLMGEIYGGQVRHVPVVLNPAGIKTPDYIINGRKFDLKEIFGHNENTLFNALAGKKEQANNFIFDVSGTKLEAVEVVEQIQRIYASKHRSWVDEIVVIKDYEVVKVFKRQ